MNTAFRALHRDLQDLVGQTVAGRYRVDSLLGVGGMAAVFQAHHMGLGRDVALKVLHPNLTQHPEVSSRFDREAKSASRLDHPNCVQVTDFGSTEAGMKFMVMQLLEGEELTGLLDGRIPAPRVVELMLQIFRGLEHAHKQGVVHRDVKPENIFVTKDHDGKEVLKLVDFGIAKMAGRSGDDTHKTTAGMVFGTPAYMSPEQAMGMEADSRSDLYSAGVLMYQMLAGRLPLDNDDPVALVRMQVSRDPDPLPPSVPPVLAGFTARLLEKDRDDRFPSASQAISMLEDLGPLMKAGRISSVQIVSAANVATAGPMQAVESTLEGVPTPPQQKQRWKLAGAAAGGLLALTLGGWALSGDDDAKASETSTQASAAGESDPPPKTADKTGAVKAVPSLLPVGDGLDAATIAEIDRLILAARADEADALLDPLHDQFPKNAQLLWRRGRVLGMRKRKESQALAAYGDALQADPDLLDDRDFYAQLYDLLRNRKIRDEALDLALQHLGVQGHKFLLELVNNESKPLQYNDRQRALAEIRNNSEDAALINTQLNLALDILQASNSLTPCTSYRTALEAIAEEPDYYYYRRVEKAEMPQTAAAAAEAGQAKGETGEGKSSDDTEACKGLDERREEVLTQLLALMPPELAEGEDESETAANGEEPKAGSKQGTPASKPKKKKTSAKSSRGCKGVAGMFKKRCR